MKKYKLKKEIKILIFKIITLICNTYILSNCLIATNTLNDFRYNWLLCVMYFIIEILIIIF